MQSAAAKPRKGQAMGLAILGLAMGGALGARGDDGPGRCAGAAAGRRAVVRPASWLPAAPTDVCSSFEETGTEQAMTRLAPTSRRPNESQKVIPRWCSSAEASTGLLFVSLKLSSRLSPPASCDFWFSCAVFSASATSGVFASVESL
eukprot:1623340-Prymnesium_polylepis.1